MKSGNLNFLELSGPLQTCKGTAFAFMNVWIRFTRLKQVPVAGSKLTLFGTNLNLNGSFKMHPESYYFWAEK